jgi:ankyrin repeat protein
MSRHFVGLLILALAGCSNGGHVSVPSKDALAASEMSAKDLALLRDPVVIRSVLSGAARDDDGDTIRSLARHGVDVDTPLGEGRTALTLAAYHRSEKAVQALLEVHADPDGHWAALSPLMHAAFAGDDAVVTELVAAGASVDRPTPYGQTTLMFAALFGRQSTYDALVRLGADENAQDRAGMTPKRLRAYANDAQAVEGFLDHASDKLGELARSVRP